MILEAAARHARPFHPELSWADGARIVLIVAAFSLLGTIGRAVKEGAHRGDMDRGQAARFIGVGGLAGSLALGSAVRGFGTSFNWFNVANFCFVMIEWWGVLHIRRQQKKEASR